jgi:hypothetical protein
VAGSWLRKETSVKPLMRARFGTEAVILMLPVEVAPSEPCEAAVAGVLVARQPAKAAPIMAIRVLEARQRLVVVVMSKVPVQVDYSKTLVRLST